MNYWKYIVISLLASVAVFHFFAVGMVISNRYELTSKDYYEQEKMVGQNKAELKAGEQLAWRWSYQEDKRLYLLSVQDAAGKPVQLKNVTINLYKPNKANQDQQLLMHTSGEGQWQAQFDGLDFGRWKATIRADHEQDVVAWETQFHLARN